MTTTTRTADTALLQGLRAGGRQQDESLREIYRQYLPVVRKLVLDNSGTEEEARDIFQDAIIVLFEQVKSGRFRGDSTLKTFLYAVAKNQWLNKLKKLGRTVLQEQEKLDALTEKALDPMGVVLKAEKNKLVQDLLNLLGEKCREIMVGVIYYRYNMVELCEMLGYKNEQIARNKHYKCKQQLKKMVNDNPAIKSLAEAIR